MLHTVGLIGLLALQLAPPHRREVITLIPLAPQMPPYMGSQMRRAPPGGYASSTPMPPPTVATATPPPAPPLGVPDSVTAPTSHGIGVSTPQLGSGLLWVHPRPALPADVADVIYNDTIARDRAVVQRLRAMVDSLNQILDQQQREHRKPTWTTQIAGQTFGIDSQYIHVLGVEIPTAALALLPIRLPEGNYGEALRARQLDLMRQDLMRAAERSETLEHFRQYVRELRARKQAEHDFQKRQKGEDSDTAKAVP